MLSMCLLLVAASVLAQEPAPPLTGEVPEGAVPATPGNSTPAPPTPAAPDALPSPGAGVIRWLTVPPAPGQQVYVRLRGEALRRALTGQPWELLAEDNGKTSRMAVKLELEANLHEVSAALGSMRTGPTGESLWPLLFESERLPIKKLKLRVAQPDSTTMPGIKLARLNADSTIADIVAEMPEPPARLDPVPPLPVWLEPEPQIRPEMWAVVVADQEQPLQLQRITAYAAELCLSFTMPESGEPVLHEADPQAREMTALDELVAPADPVQISGEVDSLAAVVAKPSFMPSLFGSKKKDKDPGDANVPGVPADGGSSGRDSSLWLGIAYGAVGMALLIGGINLLRRKLLAD
jgi:hypothetical protein